jgi:hypothetical protein
MALHDVQSAMRSLILDPLEIPEDQEERKSFLRKHFPKLSMDELEDLALVRPAALRTYTSSIYNAESGILRNHFPLTFRMLEEVWPANFGSRFDAVRFAKNLHVARPWKTSATLTLAENFRTHLLEDIPQLKAEENGIADLAALELHSLEIRRFPDTSSAREIVDSASGFETLCSELAVSDLLGLQIISPPWLRLFESRFAVLETREQFLENGSFTRPERETSLVAGTRNNAHFLRWMALRLEEFRFLERLAAPDNASTIGNLAEAFLLAEETDQNAETSEDVLFRRFLDFTVDLIDEGFIQIVLPEK